MEAKVGQGRRRWFLEIATVWVALGLSSCAQLPSDEVPPPVVMTTPPVPRPTRKPAAPPLRVPRPKATPPAAEDEAIKPNRVIGLDESDTARWLGEPDQRTDASPATVWTYLTKDCQVDVYFYLDMRTAVRRALHFDVTSDYIDEGRSERCFKQIVDEQRRRDGSPTS
jgi:hypothetical protein